MLPMVKKYNAIRAQKEAKAYYNHAEWARELWLSTGKPSYLHHWHEFSDKARWASMAARLNSGVETWQEVLLPKGREVNYA